VKEKVIEEFSELHEAQATGNADAIEDEFGDVLFSLVNYARFIAVNPEDALERTNKKFIQRFQLMEELMTEAQVNIATLNLEEMDVFWEKAKITLRAKGNS
jgi:XTP/dITP diphosphohydrolase